MITRVLDPLGGESALRLSMSPYSTPQIDHSSEGFSIGMWYKTAAGEALVPVWGYSLASPDGLTTSLNLSITRTGDDLVLSLVAYGGAAIVFPEYVDSAVSPAFHHLCLSFNGTSVSLLVDGVLWGPSVTVATVGEGYEGSITLYPTAADYFDIILHSKPLSAATLYYYTQNLEQVNPPE